MDTTGIVPNRRGSNVQYGPRDDVAESAGKHEAEAVGKPERVDEIGCGIAPFRPEGYETGFGSSLRPGGHAGNRGQSDDGGHGYSGRSECA